MSDEHHAEERRLLEAGWEWLKQAPDGEEKNAFFDRYLVKLREYERLYQMDREEEMEVQHSLGLVAKVKQGRVKD